MIQLNYKNIIIAIIFVAIPLVVQWLQDHLSIPPIDHIPILSHLCRDPTLKRLALLTIVLSSISLITLTIAKKE